MSKSKLVIAIAAIALLAACGEPRPAEDIVAERAQARWDGLVARNFQAAWQYHTPGYRQQMTVAEFEGEMSRRPVKWTAAEVFEVDCADEEPRCEVRVRIEYQAPAAVPGVGMLQSRSGITEIWLQIGGEWWYSAEA